MASLGGRGTSWGPISSWGNGQKAKVLGIWKRDLDTGDGFWRWQSRNSGGKMNYWSMPCQSKLAPWEQHCFHASQGKPGCPKPQAEILFPARTPAQCLCCWEPLWRLHVLLSFLCWQTEPHRRHKVTEAPVLPSSIYRILLFSSSPGSRSKEPIHIVPSGEEKPGLPSRGGEGQSIHPS